MVLYPNLYFVGVQQLEAHLPLATDIGQALWLLGEKLRITTAAPTVRKVSLRVYKDWEAFVCQVTLNFESVAKKANAVAKQANQNRQRTTGEPT